MADSVVSGYLREVQADSSLGPLIVKGPAASGGAVPVTTTSSAALTSAGPVSVASSATVVTLKTANTARRQLTIYNESTQVLRVKRGSAASATDYSFQLAPLDYYEAPMPIYTGVLTGIWVAANGFAQVDEGV